MRTAIITLVVALFIPVLSFSQDKETEARKLYLKASSLIRKEQYKDAKVLLDKILSDYIDTEVALKADEKLNEILDKIEAASLPTIPGCYIRKLSGDLVKLEKEPMATAGYSEKKAKTLQDALAAAMNHVNFILFATSATIAADEIESFIIFNPNQTQIANVSWALADPVKVGEGYWVDVPQGAQTKTKYVLYPRWSDISADGSTVKSDEFLKKKLSDGMYEIKTSTKYVPRSNIHFALMDGSGYAFPFVMTPAKATLLSTKYLDSWNTSARGIAEVNSAIKEQPSNVELHYLLSILHYRRGEFDDAQMTANKGLEVAKGKYNRSLKTIAAYANAAKTLKSNTPTMGESDKELRGKIYPLKGVINQNPNLHRAHFTLAKIYFDLDNFNMAAEHGNKAVKYAKQLKKATGLYSKLEKYSKNTVKEYERFTKNAECEKLLVDIRKTYVEGTGDTKKGLKMCDKAKKMNDDNPYVYDVKAQLYHKIGKLKDAKKQAKKARDKAKKYSPANIAYFEEQLTKYEEMAAKK